MVMTRPAQVLRSAAYDLANALDVNEFYRKRSQGSNPCQTRVMGLGVSRSSHNFLWT